MTTGEGIRCMWMRGGTSKAAMFLREDLPKDPETRDDLLLRIMGSPDHRQIDGIGGATSLTSKVAVISRSTSPDADVDYLFLQVHVDKAIVTDTQNCGNVLAAVGPFSVERGLIPAGADVTSVRIRMLNSDSMAVATFPTPGGQPRYDGDVHISGVPGTAAGITLHFSDTTGSSTKGLFPTGNVSDTVDGVEVTCVDNGMPVVLIRAQDLGITGYETHDQLNTDSLLLSRVDQLRQKAGALMGLGDTSGSSVPKTVVIAPPRDGGDVCTRSFIPVRPHQAVGVLAAISAVTALKTPGAVGSELSSSWGPGQTEIDVEHPSGHLIVDVDLELPPADLERATVPVAAVRVRRSGVVRTARKLFDGEVFPRIANPTNT